jgi:hypothetical protein
MPDTKPKRIVAVQDVWVQVSSNYDTTRNVRTLVVEPDTPVSKIVEWAKSGGVLGRGDVVLTLEDSTDAE